MQTTVGSGVAVASAYESEREAYYGQRGPMPFEAFDANGDGVVTAEEYDQVHRERHAARAGKGFPMRNAAPGGRFAQIDRDGDGSISREEHGGWVAERMQQRAGKGRCWTE